MCSPYLTETHGYLIPKLDYRQNVLKMFDSGYRVQVCKSWSWSYGSWYLCNQCLPPLTLWVWIPPNRINGVMVSMLASNEVDRGLEPQSGQTKDYKIDIFCLSAKHAALRRMTGLLGIGIMCPSGDTRISIDCYFSEQAL